MKNLSRFIEVIDWIVASPASESSDVIADILVSRGAVRKRHRILRAYVLINYASPQKITEKSGQVYECRSAIFRKDFSESTNLSRISAIAYFTDSFGKGQNCVSFFYPRQTWEDDRQGLSGHLIDFMRNNAHTGAVHAY
jgi:hypothetical protein